MTGRWLLYLGVVVFSLVGAEVALAKTQDEQKHGGSVGDRLPEEWSIRPELDRVSEQMSRLAYLSENLGSASAELQQAYQAFIDDPASELLRSRLEKKLALFADQVAYDFDRVIADQDELASSFKLVDRKLARFGGLVEDKLASYEARLDARVTELDDIDQDLIALAVRIKESPEGRARKRLEHKFAQAHYRRRLHERRVAGLERNLGRIQEFTNHLAAVRGLFVQLQDKVSLLVESLEDEKAYLYEAIELKIDEQKLRDIELQMTSGEGSIVKVTEQLARLYNAVTVFAGLHDRVNMATSSTGTRFSELAELSAEVSRIMPAVPGLNPDQPEELGALVDSYFDRRHELRSR